MKKLVIIPCGGRKIWDSNPNAGAQRTSDAYIGSYFKSNKVYAEAQDCGWLILSAKYGLIEPEFIITENYNVIFKDKKTNPVKLDVVKRQVKEKMLTKYDEVIVLGGKEYINMVKQAFVGEGIKIDAPFAGLPMGIQMSKIKEQLQKTVNGLNDVQEEPKLETSPFVTPLDKAKVKSPGNLFENAIQDIFKNANTEFVDVKSGDLHRVVGGYPGPNHRMPTCCTTMKHVMRGNDKILSMPPKGHGATLLIRYFMQNTGDYDMTIESTIYAEVHRLFNSLQRFKFPFDANVLPQNGIYIMFEAAEKYGDIDRIVRIGTHTGQNNFRNRLTEHYFNENKNRSIFRKNIGRALLNKDKDPYLQAWDIDFTDSQNKEALGHLRDPEYERTIEARVSEYIRLNITFTVIKVEDKQQRLALESKLIASLARNPEQLPSDTWLGRFSPEQKIVESGLWQKQHLDSEPLSKSDLISLVEKYSNSKTSTITTKADNPLMERYSKLKSIVVTRKEQFNRLITFIEKETEWLKAPASTKFHLCKESGLLEHSCNVAETMLKLKNALAPEISDESCVIVALLHDLGKVGMPGKPQYLINEPTERQKKYGYPASTPYRFNNDLTYLSVPIRSIYLVLPFIDLSEDEVQAIVYHDGQYVEDNASVATKETPLTLMLQYADTWSGFVIEEDRI